MRTTSARVASPRPKCTTGDVIELLLHVQAGPQLDLAADAERVDALIAGRRRRARPQHLPVIRLRARGSTARPRLPVAASADELEPAVAVEIGDRLHAEREARAVERRERAAGRAEQHARARRPRDDQVGGAVVVEIGDAAAGPRPAPAAGGRIRRATGRSARHVPSLARARDGRSSRRATSTSRSNIASPFSSAAAIATAWPDGGRQRLRAEAAAAQVQEHVDGAGLVEERRVGHAFAVEIGPGEAARARDRRRTDRAARTCRRRCCAARSEGRRAARARDRDRRRCRCRRATRRTPARAGASAGSFAAAVTSANRPAAPAAAGTGRRRRPARDRSGSRSSDPRRRRRPASDCRSRRLARSTRRRRRRTGNVNACRPRGRHDGLARRQSSETAPIHDAPGRRVRARCRS